LISVWPEEEFRNVLKSSSFLFEAEKEEAKEKSHLYRLDHESGKPVFFARFV
jgi:hypothetical protein